MAIEIEAILDAIVSHAMTQGLFDSVNKHEPKSAPGTGLNAGIWVQSMEPVSARSGLNTTSARIQFTCRIYGSMLQSPMDEIDPTIAKAADALFRAYHEDFTLDGLVAEVDLLGAYGSPLTAEMGYLEIDKQLMRVMDITVPVIINDVWSQNP